MSGAAQDDGYRDPAERDRQRTQSVVRRGLIIEIIAERLRQRTQKGYMPERDDSDTGNELALAAAAYAAQDVGLWPPDWSLKYWKPQDRRRDLIRAGALILAELERLDRMSGVGDVSSIQEPDGRSHVAQRHIPSSSKTIADVKCGDEVVLREGRYWFPRRVHVDRLTNTQIIIGSRRFRRKDGREIGGPFSYSEVVFSDEAERLIAEARRVRAVSLWRLVACSERNFNPAGIRAVRAACDAAEAALRELGEWEGE
jgi:hypothetical protein